LTGTIADARFPATLPAASAANLTSILLQISLELRLLVLEMQVVPLVKE